MITVTDPSPFTLLHIAASVPSGVVDFSNASYGCCQAAIDLASCRFLCCTKCETGWCRSNTRCVYHERSCHPIKFARPHRSPPNASADQTGSQETQRMKKNRMSQVLQYMHGKVVFFNTPMHRLISINVYNAPTVDVEGVGSSEDSMR